MNNIIFIIYILLGAGGITLFKLGSDHLNVKFSLEFLQLNIPIIVIMGMLCYIISFVLWFYLLSKSDISVLSPIATGIMTVTTFIIGTTIFRESISIPKISGVTLIIIGVIIINMAKG